MIAAARCALALCCAISNIVFGEVECRARVARPYAAEICDNSRLGFESDSKTKAGYTNLIGRCLIAQASNKEKFCRVICGGAQTGLKCSRGDFSSCRTIGLDFVIREQCNSGTTSIFESDNVNEYLFLRSFDGVGVANDRDVANEYIGSWCSSVVLVGNRDIGRDISTWINHEPATRIGLEVNGYPWPLIGDEQLATQRIGLLGDGERTASVATLPDPASPGFDPKADSREGKHAGPEREPEGVSGNFSIALFPLLLGGLIGLLLVRLVVISLPSEPYRRHRQNQHGQQANGRITPPTSKRS